MVEANPSPADKKLTIALIGATGAIGKEIMVLQDSTRPKSKR